MLINVVASNAMHPLSSRTSLLRCGLKFRVRPSNWKCGGYSSTAPKNADKISRRHIYASPTYHAKRQKDLFTPSPFARSDKINVGDSFAIQRELKEGGTYGVRRYLLLPRTDDESGIDEQQYSANQIIASLNANKNVLFGAQLHIRPSSTTSSDVDDEYISQYLSVCGSLLDVAKEDASINGQQVQALATLNGLCLWVKECLDRDGEGSEVLRGLMHGDQQPNALIHDMKEERNLPSGKRANQNITNASAKLVLEREQDRITMLEAIRAISTGKPRPGHSVVGVGTYRDGMKGWVALAREYSQLTTASEDSVVLDASLVGRKGLEEVALYKSRGGEVTKIEHLAHTQPEYLKEAGGAMARLFFV